MAHNSWVGGGEVHADSKHPSARQAMAVNPDGQAPAGPAGPSPEGDANLTCSLAQHRSRSRSSCRLPARRGPYVDAWTSSVLALRQPLSVGSSLSLSCRRRSRGLTLSRRAAAWTRAGCRRLARSMAQPGDRARGDAAVGLLAAADTLAYALPKVIATPRVPVGLLGALVDPQPSEAAYNPCSGDGRLLFAAAAHLRRQSPGDGSVEDGLLLGQGRWRPILNPSRSYARRHRLGRTRPRATAWAALPTVLLPGCRAPWTSPSPTPTGGPRARKGVP